MALYLLKDGTKTTPHDPARLIWYSVFCTFWTDDWTKLSKRADGIPCCPICNHVGCQTSFAGWECGIREYERKFPGYKVRLDGYYNNCEGLLTLSLRNWRKQALRNWRRQNEYSRKTEPDAGQGQPPDGQGGVDA